MSTRVFMLGFILSRMLNPLSYSVFILFFVLVVISTGNIIPTTSLQAVADAMSPLYLPLILTSVVAHLLVIGFIFNFLYRVIIEGKFIVKLSTLGCLLAISAVQVFTYFCMNALPQISTKTMVEKQLSFLFDQNMIHVLSLSSLLLMGMLLALYIGVLGREKFKKNIGFIDDTLCE